MSKIEYLINNKGVKIHCVEFNRSLNTTPLIIIPGATNSAEEIAADLQSKLQLHHVIISLRGRGKSSSPNKGYSLDEHATDVISVIQHLNLKKCYVFGHSVGSTVGIRVAHKKNDVVCGLILGDFPPFFPPFDKSWASMVIKKNKRAISEVALLGLANEGKYLDVSEDFENIFCDVLLLKGGKKDSAFPTEQISFLRKRVKKLEVEILEDSGHDIFRPTPDELIEKLEKFIIEVEKKG